MKRFFLILLVLGSTATVSYAFLVAYLRIEGLQRELAAHNTQRTGRYETINTTKKGARR
jgi:hypothetical protein